MVQRGRYCPRKQAGENNSISAQSDTFLREAKTP